MKKEADDAEAKKRRQPIMRIEEKAFAKINLTLDITAVLPDRYHSIFSVMQTVGLWDRVTVEPAAGGGVTLQCSDDSLPCDERNTAYQAAALFLQQAGVDGGAAVTVEKKNA